MPATIRDIGDMREHGKLWLGAAVVLLSSLSVAPSVRAQQGWLADRAAPTGPGIRVGDFELHPGIAAEAGIDSNFYNQPAGFHTPSAMLRVSPHLLFSTLGSQRREGAPPPMLAFSAGLRGRIFHFFAEPERLRVGGSGDVSVDIAPQRPVSLVVGNRFNRTVRPFVQPDLLVLNPTTGETEHRVLSRRQWGHNSNEARATLRLGAPSRLLTGRIGYRLQHRWFDDELFNPNNSVQHTGEGQIGWRFLPATSLVYETSLTRRIFTNETVRESNALVRANGTLYRNELGVSGGLTPRLSVDVGAGYTTGFFDMGDAFGALTGRAHMSYRVLETMRLFAGYRRSAHAAFFGNYSTSDNFTAGMNAMVLGRLSLETRLGLRFVSWGRPLAWLDETSVRQLGNLPERRDTRLTAELAAEYRFASWLALIGSVRYINVLTDYVYEWETLDPDEFAINPAEFDKLVVWAGVQVFY